MSEENKTQGAWIITDVFSKHGVRITVKSSGDTTQAAADDLYSGIAHGMEKYGWTIEQAGTPKPAATVSATTPAPAQSVVGNLPAVIDTNINTLEVVKVVVTPKPDSKVELQLFGAGHKFPDLYHNGTVAQVLAALSGTGLEWTEDHLKVASDFSSHFLADWRNSEKLNKNGKPYKNIINYRSAEATA
jgi:hypothetical protein